MFTLGVRDASASSVQHPLFPLCVCIEIVRDNPFGVLILYYPLSSAKLRIFICLILLLHTTLVLSFPFCFYKCSTVLSIFWSGWKRMTQTPKLRSFAVSFLHALCGHRSVGPGLNIFLSKTTVQSWPNLVCSISSIRRQKIVNLITPHSKGSLFWGKNKKN